MRTKPYQMLIAGALFMFGAAACNKTDDDLNLADQLLNSSDAAPTVIMRGGVTAALPMTTAPLC